MIRLRAAAAAALALLFLAGSAAAHEEAVANITLKHPWSRPAAQGQNGAIYLDIVNRGATDDRLIAVTTPIARKVELHRSTMRDGIHRMEKVDGIAVPAGGVAKLAPGGLHVMLIGLTVALWAEETFPVTFTLERAGDIAVNVSVETPGGGTGHSDHGNGER